MNILLAPDKFKGSISAEGVCQALAKGLKKDNPSLNIITKPLADGGDGSLAVLDYYFDLETVTLTVQDPLGRPIRARYKKTGTTAYIEMAAASGLVLLTPEERNCMYTTTFGTGELMRDAIEKGIQEIFLFIGGSATNDGGMGMANALGYQFFNAKGNLLKPIGKSLIAIDKIDNSQVSFDWDNIKIKVICDVNNPFYGKNGAAHIYAKQKGANPSEIIQLDKGLKNLATRLVTEGFPDIAKIAGAGAAGGIGGGAMAFLNAQLKSGIQTFLEITDLASILSNCDLIITGEGKLDGQTAQGKVISGICELARKYDKKVIAVCGMADFPIPSSLNLTEIFTVKSRSTSLEDAMNNTAIKLTEIGQEISAKYLNS